MTLRQFFKLAGGLIIAFFFYSTGLPFIFKWPMVLGFAGLGAALAFLPINEQPLEKWLIIFFKSIYSPTIYLWQKRAVPIDVLSDDWTPSAAPVPTPAETEEKDKGPQLKEFLKSLPEDDEDQQPKPKKEKQKIEEKEEKEIETKQKPEIEFDLPEREAPEATAKTEFGEIPMPSRPKTPNIVVGMVTDGKGKIIENVIIEIQDSDGNPVRALRTNQLGQFKTITPLSNGEYLILAEKENYNFDILKIEAEGKLIQPLKIKAKQNGSK